MATPRPIAAGLFETTDDTAHLRAARCAACEKLHFPATPTCPYCGGGRTTATSVGPAAASGSSRSSPIARLRHDPPALAPVSRAWCRPRRSSGTRHRLDALHGSEESALPPGASSRAGGVRLLSAGRVRSLAGRCGSGGSCSPSSSSPPAPCSPRAPRGGSWWSPIRCRRTPTPSSCWPARSPIARSRRRASITWASRRASSSRARSCRAGRRRCAATACAFRRSTSWRPRLSRALGVPPGAIESVPRRAHSTTTEARAIARWACGRGLRRLVVVTSPTHTRRARLILRQALGPDVALSGASRAGRALSRPTAGGGSAGR